MTTSSSVATPITTSRTSPIWLWFSRIVIALPIFVLLMVNLRYVLDPIHAASPTGVTLSTPEALTDTRDAGAAGLVIALVLVWTLFGRGRLWIGHAVVIAFMALALAIRLFGFTQDGTTLAMGNQKAKVLIEVVFIVLSAVALATQTRARGQEAA